MDARAFEGARIAGLPKRKRSRPACHDSDLYPACGFALGALLSLAIWTLIGLLLRALG